MNNIEKKVVIVGGGWSGCAAAIQAKKSGADVVLLERMDMLLGTGLVGGIMRNNGRFTATEEMIAMGCGDLFQICDDNSKHKNIDFPGHKHANLYDISKIHTAVYNHILNLGIVVEFETRIRNVNVQDGKIINLIDQDKNEYFGDVFIDATGTAGPTKNCVKYGNGCAMCILRCPTFGGRLSLSKMCGLEELQGKKADGTFGSMSGSCKLFKESLSKKIQDELNEKGVAVIEIPKHLRKDKTGIKACQQYASKEFAENIILLDTGHAKLMTPFFSIHELNQIPGFENARFEDPYSGGIGNSMRYFDICKHNKFLQVDNIDNLFCAGEKVGPLVGHTEAIVTGTLAGFNAVKMLNEEDLFVYPNTLAVGDAMEFLEKSLETDEGLSTKITFSGSIYFKQMQDKGLYAYDISDVRNKVKDAGVEGVFN